MPVPLRLTLRVPFHLTPWDPSCCGSSMVDVERDHSPSLQLHFPIWNLVLNPCLEGKVKCLIHENRVVIQSLAYFLFGNLGSIANEYV